MNTDKALREKLKSKQKDWRDPEAVASSDKDGHHKEPECPHQLTSSSNDSDSDSSGHTWLISSTLTWHIFPGMPYISEDEGKEGVKREQPASDVRLGPPLKLKDVDTNEENSSNTWSITSTSTWHSWP